MSTLYNLEPHPTAKCILHTSSGDILLELFGQQTPLTTRNFLQHCLDGYYDDTIFHRLVPGFILQGGDPTNTGSGGESIYDGGKPFADEFHTRLRFNRRGLLGMANAGEKDDNGSQFFLTLGKTEELYGRHTMFGRVVGDTIYNLVKMGEAELVETEGSERPMFPTKITSTEILVNPYEDMVARPRVAKRTAEDDRPAIKKRKKKAAGKSMLSFAGDDPEDDAELSAPIIKNKFNPKLVSATADPISRPSRPPPSSSEQPPLIRRRKSPTPSPTPSPPPSKPLAPSTTTSNKRPAPARTSPTPTASPSPSPPPSTKEIDPLSAANAQIAALKSSLRRNVADPATSAPKPQDKKALMLKSMIPAGAIKGRKKGSAAHNAARERDEKRALKIFQAFGKRLEDAVPAPPSPSAEERKESEEAPTNGAATADEPPEPSESGHPTAAVADDENICDLHFIPNCQSCSRWDAVEGGKEDDDADAAGFMSHKLTFAKDRLGKSLEWKRQNETELVVIDPREREKGFREERKKERKERVGR